MDGIPSAGGPKTCTIADMQDGLCEKSTGRELGTRSRNTELLEAGAHTDRTKVKMGDQRGAIAAFAKPVLSGSTALRVTCWASAASCLLCSASVSS